MQIFWSFLPLSWGFFSRSSPLGTCIHFEFRIGQHRTPYHEFIRLYVQCRLCWHHFSWRNCMDLQLVFRFGGGQTKGHDRRRQWDCKLLISYARKYQISYWKYILKKSSFIFTPIFFFNKHLWEDNTIKLYWYIVHEHGMSSFDLIWPKSIIVSRSH